MAFQTGKLSACSIGGTAVKIEDATVTPKVDTFDYSNGVDGIVFIPGLIEYDIELQIGFDPTLTVYTTLTLGTELANLIVYHQGSSGGSTKAFTFTRALVTEAPFRSTVRGKQMITVRAKGFGTVSNPTA